MKCSTCNHEGDERHDCVLIILDGLAAMVPGGRSGHLLHVGFIRARYNELKIQHADAEQRAANSEFVLETFRQEALARAALAKKLQEAIRTNKVAHSGAI
jgi:hypothetical protein